MQQAGYKADDLQDITWDQLIEIGKDVKAKTGHQMLGIDINDARPHPHHAAIGRQWYFNDDGSPIFADNPAFKAALEQLCQDPGSPGSTSRSPGWNNYHRRLHLR